MLKAFKTRYQIDSRGQHFHPVIIHDKALARKDSKQHNRGLKPSTIITIIIMA